MATPDTYNQVLEYLKKGSANTFRLARELDIERDKILDILKKLEETGVVELRAGMAHLLKLPVEEKKPARVKKAVPKPEKIDQTKILEDLRAENERYRKKISELEKTIKELEQKARAPPKIITKTIIKKVPIRPKKVKRKAKPMKVKSSKPKRKSEISLNNLIKKFNEFISLKK